MKKNYTKIVKAIEKEFGITGGRREFAIAYLNYRKSQNPFFKPNAKYFITSREAADEIVVFVEQFFI